MRVPRWLYTSTDGRTYKVYAPTKKIAAERIAAVFGVSWLEVISSLERTTWADGPGVARTHPYRAPARSSSR